MARRYYTQIAYKFCEESETFLFGPDLPDRLLGVGVAPIRYLDGGRMALVTFSRDLTPDEDAEARKHKAVAESEGPPEFSDRIRSVEVAALEALEVAKAEEKA